jgi:hypothetical protein
MLHCRRLAVPTSRLYEEYFSEESIIRELCKERARKAKKRNETLFFRRIATSEHPGRIAVGPNRDLVDSLLPPRKLWHRYRARQRGNYTSVDLNTKALFAAVIALRESSPTLPWVTKLNRMIKVIRKRVLEPSRFKFSSPRIVPVEKDRTKKTYRPIAVFDRLDDKIIDCLAARYLREALDVVLLPSCWAFRCRRNGNPPPTIHSALEKILELTARKESIYVAECDIKAFFDCVSHRVAIDSINELIAERKRALPRDTVAVDERALVIFRAYLDSYSFRRTVTGGALKALKDKKGQDAHFPWPEAELREFYSEKDLCEIGVPQGGALSCLVANATLHGADKALLRLSERSGSGFTYLRYCDDMILLAEDPAICRKAFERYAQILRQKLLPMHQPKHPAPYSKNFYEGKSHLPYCWGKDVSARQIPWIQFVGYQVRRDGLIRVRLKSLKKELRKITSTADELLAVLTAGTHDSTLATHIRKTRRQIIHRFRQKLISMSVGRIVFSSKKERPMPMCWASGFRGLKSRNFIRAALKVLDRQRERQIARVGKRIESLETPPFSGSEVRPVEVLRFYGCPFSYYGQFGENIDT